MKNFVLISICVIFFSSCSTDVSLNKLERIDFEKDTLIRITNWYALLPFRPDVALPVLNRQDQDFLIPFGKSENQIKNLRDFIPINTGGFAQIGRHKTSASYFRFFRNRATQSATILLFGYHHKKSEKKKGYSFERM